jgi:uncharacterized membrane protein
MKSFLFAFLVACSSGTPSGATCPDSNAPTYGSFAKEFFATYCTQCHSATSNDRHDAPGDDNFDTEADILAHASEIDTEAAKGPKATNTDMPDLGTAVKTAPTDEERALLGQYLACAQAKN